jgi:hypothetical protein
MATSGSAIHRPSGEDLATPALRLHGWFRKRQGLGPDRKGLEALHQRRDHQQVAAADDEQPRHRGAEEAAAGGAGGWRQRVEEAGEVQAHLQADDLAGKLHRREHHAHRKAQRQADHQSAAPPA